LDYLPLFTHLYNFKKPQAFGQESTDSSAVEKYVFRNGEVWGLFYRMMVAAFIVGAVVQGVILYVCWRYRESHKKNRFVEPLKGDIDR
jgi:hypothetical protein